MLLSCCLFVVCIFVFQSTTTPIGSCTKVVQISRTFQQGCTNKYIFNKVFVVVVVIFVFVVVVSVEIVAVDVIANKVVVLLVVIFVDVVEIVVGRMYTQADLLASLSRTPNQHLWLGFKQNVSLSGDGLIKQVSN